MSNRLLTISLCLLTLNAGTRSVSAEKPPVPPNARVGLSADQDEYFLGENVLVYFTLENSGGKPFKVDVGGDSRGAARALRFKVSVTEETSTKPLADPYPSQNNFGGMCGSPEITTGKPFHASLPIVRYARFVQPGTYQITVHHDFGWEEPPMDGYPKAEMTLRFKRPSAVEAAALVKKWLAAGEYGGSTFGQKAEPHSDFSQIRFNEYLEPLTEPAKQGDKNAIVGIGSINSPSATKILIELAREFAMSRDDSEDEPSEPKTKAQSIALSQLCMRLPDPYLRGELELRNPFEDGLKEPRRWLVETSWKDEFSPAIREIATALLNSSDQGSVATGAYILECVGTIEDAPNMIAALDREIQKTRRMKVRTDLYPRPRGACMELQRAAFMLLKRGLTVPVNPKSSGECILFATELKRNKNFRPPGWQETCDRILQTKTPYVQEQILKRLPTPMPESLRPHLSRILASKEIDSRIEACHIVKREKLIEFKKPILKILKTADEDWLYSAADNAAIALDTNYRRIEILVSRLDEPEMVFKCLDSLKSIFANTGGGGWNSNIDGESEASRIKPLWEAFILENASDLKASKKYELPHPLVTAEMFPKQFTMTLKSGGSWPERN